jgi:hypothetical protein
MPAPLKAGIPPDLDLDGGYTISFTALSPTTGALVAGVVVSAFAARRQRGRRRPRLRLRGRDAALGADP